MTFESLKYCIEAARTNSFTEAAKACNVTAQSVSQQIHKLEAQIGFKLFDCTNKKVTPTPAGKRFIDGLKDIINNFNDVVEEAGKIAKAQSHSFSIGCYGNIGRGIVIDLVNEFVSVYPDITPEIHYSTRQSIVKAFNKGILDVICSGYGDDLNLEQCCMKPWIRNKINAVIGINHPLATNETVTVDELLCEQLICIDMRSDPETHSRRMEYFRKIFGGRLPDRIKYVEDTHSADFYVASGQGFALLSASSKGLTYDKRMIFKEIDGVDYYSTSWIVWHKDNKNPWVDRFLKIKEDMENSL